MGRRVWIVLGIGLALALPPLLRAAGAPPAGQKAAPVDLGGQQVLIFRPPEANQTVLDPETLLEVPAGNTCLFERRLLQPWRCGLMYGFVVEVSAFTSIQWIRINGRMIAQPHATWFRRLVPVVLNFGHNKIVVDAATSRGVTRRVFPLRVAGTRLPGTSLFFSAPRGEHAGTSNP